METKSNYLLRVTYSADIEDHVDGYCSDEDLDPIYNKQMTDTIRLYHSGSKYITEYYYDRYLLHNPGQIVPNSELLDISSDNLMNDKIIAYLTNYYTEPGCSTDGSGVCEARGVFNVAIISVELLED